MTSSDVQTKNDSLGSFFHPKQSSTCLPAIHWFGSCFHLAVRHLVAGPPPFFLQLQSTSPHATRVEPLFASTIGYPRDLWPRLFRQSPSLHPDCAVLAAPSADMTRSRRRSTARSLAFTGYHAERRLLVLLAARPLRWKATFYTDSLNVQRCWKKGQEHSIRGQFIYTSTWRQIWDRIDEIKPDPMQVKRMTDDATMEHVREGAVTPCKGDLPGLVREVSLQLIIKFR